MEPTLSIGPQALKKFENANTVPLGNFEFSFNCSTKLFELIRKAASSMKYIGKARRGVIDKINAFAKILGTVRKRYKTAPIIVSLIGGLLIPLVRDLLVGS